MVRVTSLKHSYSNESDQRGNAGAVATIPNLADFIFHKYSIPDSHIVNHAFPFTVACAGIVADSDGQIEVRRGDDLRLCFSSQLAVDPELLESFAVGRSDQMMDFTVVDFDVSPRSIGASAIKGHSKFTSITVNSP